MQTQETARQRAQREATEAAATRRAVELAELAAPPDGVGTAEACATQERRAEAVSYEEWIRAQNEARKHELELATAGVNALMAMGAAVAELATGCRSIGLGLDALNKNLETALARQAEKATPKKRRRQK